MSESVIHLEKMHHDVVAQTTEIWCDANWMHEGNVTADIDQCTCLTCLEEARAFGRACEKRWRAVVCSPEGIEQTERDAEDLLRKSSRASAPPG